MTSKTVVYTYGTGNPVEPNGSGDVRDGIDNLQSFDVFMNAEEDTYNQRDGEIVQTVAGAIRSVGFKPGAGDFTTGFTVMPGGRDYAWYDPVSKNHYSYLGVIPPSGHVVSPATDPVGDPDWKPVTDQLLREELAQQSGSSMVGFIQAGTGSAQRTAQDKMRERITPQDKGAVGDGVTNDQAAFTALESMPAGTEVDLLGKTYLVDVLPINHRYINGYIKHSVDNYVYDANQHLLLKVGNRTALLAGAGPVMPKWVKYRGPLSGYNVYGIGFDALSKNEDGRNCVAIGSGALHEQVNGRYNVAIGLESQYYVNSDDGAAIRGTRNTSIGDNSMRFNVTGYSNCAMGRNAGQCITSVNFNTALGSASMGGYAPIGLDGETIENQAPITAGSQTHIGTNSGLWSNGVGNTSCGVDAARNIKTGQITAFGLEAGRDIEINRHYNGKEKLFISKSGTYSWAGGTITCTISAHGLATGYTILAVINGSEGNYLPVTVIDANTFTISTPYIKTETGSMSFSEVITNTALAPVTGVIAIGNKAMSTANNCTNSVAIGELSQNVSVAGSNVSVGGLTLNQNTTGTQHVAVGYSALRNNTTGNQSTAIGDFAASNNTTGGRIVAVGKNALRVDQSGANMDGMTNVVGLGTETRVSGSNQVQIGDAATTTYVYGTVQNRSDIRDKADIQDTQLGIDFIMGLRPVDGRWDLRDDYVSVDEEGNVTHLEKDGSKKRERFHHWFIAQEVKELCDSLGVEFGGYQDHSVNGGCDVLSLGYDEFIPPLTKAVQDCWKEIESIKARLDAAGL